MGKVKFELDSAGVRELLKSAEMAAECDRHAQRIAQTAGSGYAVERRTYPERVGAAVFPETPEAVRDNLKHNTLLKAVGGGGG